MKTAEDYIRQINDRFMPHPYNLSRKQREEFKSLIREIQKESYNQALEDAAENVEIEACNEYQGEQFGYLRIRKQSILRLKKES